MGLGIRLFLLYMYCRSSSISDTDWFSILIDRSPRLALEKRVAECRGLKCIWETRISMRVKGRGDQSGDLWWWKWVVKMFQLKHTFESMPIRTLPRYWIVFNYCSKKNSLLLYLKMILLARFYFYTRVTNPRGYVMHHCTSCCNM